MGPILKVQNLDFNIFQKRHAQQSRRDLVYMPSAKGHRHHNLGVTHYVPTSFITMNAVGTEWVTPGLRRT